ncbi:MAG: hypothetical protein PHD29_00060 [bacterium]|nr:hypothetical protein [bacterium]
MIISSRISEIYDNIQQKLELLKREIDPVLDSISLRFDGLFSSRIKEKESFAQKIETGKYANHDDIIDLYAATIVVATHVQVELIKRDVEKQFIVIKQIKNRSKEYSNFIYDDLHLHINYNPQVSVPGKEYLMRPFELQIKTFLQHGWAKATHDILYKGDKLLWPRFRIAHQIKAMLEQSDQILGHIDEVANICPDNNFEDFARKARICVLIQKTWGLPNLPQNMHGLVNEIYEVLNICNKEVTYLEQNFESDKYKYILSAHSITPFQAVLGILIDSDVEAVYKGFRNHRRNMYISKELKDIFGPIPPKIQGLIINL